MLARAQANGPIEKGIKIKVIQNHVMVEIQAVQLHVGSLVLSQERVRVV
jgi:hypothetical protein